MSAKERKQKEMFIELFGFLFDKFKEKELDDLIFEEEEGWERVKIIFRPKDK